MFCIVCFFASLSFLDSRCPAGFVIVPCHSHIPPISLVYLTLPPIPSHTSPHTYSLCHSPHTAHLTSPHRSPFPAHLSPLSALPLTCSMCSGSRAPPRTDWRRWDCRRRSFAHGWTPNSRRRWRRPNRAMARVHLVVDYFLSVFIRKCLVDCHASFVCCCKVFVWGLISSSDDAPPAINFSPICLGC